jgi:hypothetical protein
MIRIKFDSDKDRIDGSYLLMTKSVARRFRGNFFEITERDRKLLDDHQIHYTVVPVIDPATGLEVEIRDPSPLDF